ncbi:MAG: DNA methyltransferase [Gammaproteobacteria bacterium]|nr:DNA methyltransferase [Gammaproteobacteria bacterium]
MNSASVDLIYLDPPYSKNKTYSAPIGSKAAGAWFKDTWTLDDVNLAWHGEIKHEHPGLYALLQGTREVHSDGMMSYLISMAVRLMEMRRILKPTGTIWLHCDPTAGHYLKALLDCIFGYKNFVAEVAWFIGSRSGAIAKYKPGKAHETLLAYAASYKKHTYNIQYLPYSEKYLKWFRHEDEHGRKYQTRKKNGKIKRQYLDESPGVPLHDTWMDISHLYTSQGWFPGNRSEITGYPTQKPLALLQRIIKASSHEGDVVLDPFCGCATACIAAEIEHREWVGIDISPKAADLVQDRMENEIGAFYEGVHRTDVPERTDLGKVIRYNDARNKRYLYGEQGGYCNGCETHFELRHFHVDHIIPKAKGGTDHISNLQLLCGHCNSVKGARSQEYLLACLTDKGWIKRKMVA